MFFLSVTARTRMMMINDNNQIINSANVICGCTCLNWSEYSTPSEIMVNCDSCNTAACRKMGGSCSSGTIIGINCIQNS